MRRFIVSTITTVDGRHEGPGRDATAMPFDDGFSRHDVELLRGAGTILQGSAGWDGGVNWSGVDAADLVRRMKAGVLRDSQPVRLRYEASGA